MPDFETITYERRDKVVYVTLNRPDILNALNDKMGEELAEAWFAFDGDPEAQVAILSGAGRAFCSGADVRQRQLRPREELERLGGPIGRGARVDALMNMTNWKPLIGAIHGYAYGAGWALANRCDLLIAAAGTKCQISEVRRGLGAAHHWAPNWFWSGDRFANEVAITGRDFTAEEAYAHGMLNYVVPQDELMTKAEALAAEVLKNPPLSVRAGVRIARYHLQRMEHEGAMYNQALKLHLSEDFREGAQAFMEKRPPQFKGR
jgi:enoyl-CoA hydratase/carnithine racemase